MDPLTCSRCGAEVRHGSRDGGLTVAWLHRDPEVDHIAVLGTPYSPEYMAVIEAEMDAPRTRVVVKRRKVKETKAMEAYVIEWCEVETYTTREADRARMSKAKRDALDAEEAAEVDDDEEPEAELEPIEVYSMPFPLKGVLDVETPSGKRPVAVPGGARNIINACERAGWEILEFTYSRGPWMGAKGGSLGVADCHRLTIRGGTVDSGPIVGVAWWRDAKAQGVWLIKDKTTTRIGAKALIQIIKETPSGPTE